MFIQGFFNNERVTTRRVDKSKKIDRGDHKNGSFGGTVRARTLCNKYDDILVG